jgi:diphosphomevalonate decarboxylase
LRRRIGVDHHYDATSTNNFPTAAGLASSSSGFAALACACARASGRDVPPPVLSELARVGSASAARALFAGWVILPAGARRARPLFGPEHWPEIRVVVATVRSGPKDRPSRDAMEHVRRTSPYYGPWVRDSRRMVRGALDALQRRDLEALGEAMRASYLRMFATMLAARPAVLYWEPASVALIHECAAMRREGIGAWETMDAGPQVKIFCEARDLPAIEEQIGRLDPELPILTANAGHGPFCDG